MKTQQQKIILSLAALAAVLALFFGLWFANRPDTASGDKSISVSVVHKDGIEKTFSYQTDAQYLAEVLLAENLISGEEGAYGLYVTTVDGETADYTVDGSWWSLTKNGQLTATGVSDTPIADGDSFALTYTVDP